MSKFTNQAKISYNGITANSNIVTGELTQIIRAEKHATVSEYRHGEVLTYVVSLENSGTTDVTNLTITDDLGAYRFGAGTLTPLTYTGDPMLYHINGALQTAPAVTAGPPLVISGINVPAGKSSTLTYRVRVNDYAPLGAGAEIENTVTVAGGGLTNSVIATELVTAAQDAHVAIVKSINPTTVVENGRVNYTFTIENTGASAVDAASKLVLNDTFSPAFEDPIEVSLDGGTWAKAGNYTYDPATGEFATVEGQITMLAAEYQQEADGRWSTVPKIRTLTVTGTI